MNRILFVSLLAVLLIPSVRRAYEVLNVEGAENVTINSKGVIRGQTVQASDLVLVRGKSKLSVRKCRNGNPIEISSADMIDDKQTELISAIDRCLLRRDKMTIPGVTRKGSARMPSSIAIIDKDGSSLNAALAGRSCSTEGYFQIVNESENNLFYRIGWNDSKGFRFIGDILEVKAGETYKSGLKKFAGIEKGETLFLYASMDRYQTEQFELIDYVDF